jgi:CelD/BcsL family acetyltransferase involved in cellulose biosynthesis
VTTESGLSALKVGWDDLVVSSPRPSPFMLHDWVVEWWRHYGQGSELAVSVARRNGRLVAALPLFVHRARGVRVAKFLGGRDSHLADLLLLDATDDEAARAVLNRARGGAYDYADLFGLPTGSRLGTLLDSQLELIERVDSPVLDLTNGWDAVYKAKQSSKRRSNYRRKRQLLSELGTLEVELARTWAEVEPALEEGHRVHAIRWQGRPDGSDLQSERGRSFRRAAYRRLADANVARVITLKLDGRAIAFHSYLAFCDTLYGNGMAFDPEFARYSPGFLNTLDMLEAASAEGLRRVEFLGGREEYKLALADGFEPIFEGFGLARTARGRVAATGALAGVKLRLRLRDSPVRRFYFEELAPVRRAFGRLRRRDRAAA